jgi:hypothetical protein
MNCESASPGIGENPNHYIVTARPTGPTESDEHNPGDTSSMAATRMRIPLPCASEICPVSQGLGTETTSENGGIISGAHDLR